MPKNRPHCQYGRAVIEKRRTDPDAEFLGGSNRGECSSENGPQTLERPRKIKGLEGSNPPFSANQSPHFAYMLERAENSARNAAFFPPETHRSDRYGPHLRPDGFVQLRVGFVRYRVHSGCARDTRLPLAGVRAIAPDANRGDGGLAAHGSATAAVARPGCLVARALHLAA